MILRTILNLLYTIFYESQHKSSVAEGHGTDYYISADVDILIIVSACRPFYERNRARVDFKTCDGAWMNTGSVSLACHMCSYIYRCYHTFPDV